MSTTDKIIYKDKDLTVTLETWRGPGINLFDFEVNGLLLRVRSENGVLSVIFNRGEVEVPNDEAHPVVLSLRKPLRKR